MIFTTISLTVTDDEEEEEEETDDSLTIPLTDRPVHDDGGNDQKGGKRILFHGNF